MIPMFKKASLAIAATLCLSGGALAQTTKIKIADSFPVGHYLPKYITTPMIERLKANPAAKGFEFEYYPAEQMGKAKDFLSLVQSGVIDIAYVAPGLARFQYAIVAWHEPVNSSGSSDTTESGILSDTNPGAT